MALTIILAKVFGIYLVILGVACLARRKYFSSVFAGFVDNRLLRMVIAVVELIAGLFLVITHQDWSNLASGIITFFGWAMTIEGVAYLFLSDRAVAKLFKIFNTKAWYFVGGLLSIAVGLYLISVGWDLNWSALLAG